MQQKVDMGQVVGSRDILFLCLDTLRYDVAKEEERNQGTPVLNQYGSWEKCQAVGNFTYPAHQALFAGFFPCPADAKSHKERLQLFFPANVGTGRKPPEGSFLFDGSNIVQGLEAAGYETYCIGGVSFFDKRSPIGKVLPGYFQHSYWNPSFACPVKENTANQIAFAVKLLQEAPEEKRVFLYINISAIHYPNYFYLEEEEAQGRTQDSRESHRAALRYVDSQLDPLFTALKKRGDTFVICCSDHGTCYGEDGCYSHGINHPAVNTIPYKHFFL